MNQYIQFIIFLEKKSKLKLYKLYSSDNLSQRLQLHSITDLIIKCSDSFYELYKCLENTRDFTHDDSIVYISFINPFNDILNISSNAKNYT